MDKYILFTAVFLINCQSPTRTSNEFSTIDISQEKNTLLVEKSIPPLIIENQEFKKIYFSSHERMCEELNLFFNEKENDFPDKINFSLSLFSSDTIIDLQIQGSAMLSSSNESFYDLNSPNEGAYFAADYVFSGKDMTIRIRLDIEDFEACVVYVSDLQDEINSKILKPHFMAYPNYSVMKPGICRKN